MDTNILDDAPAFYPPTPEQSLLAHLILGRAAYEARAAQNDAAGNPGLHPWDELGERAKYAWAIAAHAVLARALPMQNHESAVMRVIAEPVAAGDEPPPLLPPPPKVQDDGEPPPIYPPPPAVVK